MTKARVVECYAAICDLCRWTSPAYRSIGRGGGESQGAQLAASPPDDAERTT